ncbi:hypothetical protein F1654_08615 [Alkalicaulis satelles]|uniref:Bacteriocin n=1 Tax=Alkalicaulis satelles TaxID=2609175 RepID=A0A5M6ZNP5_9PROT|nr:hypothetical protein [Alkalicaulis satelles]KAA5803851.1 hypothetical protein F1654_08615 [Alkalicaulis satelles]
MTHHLVPFDNAAGRLLSADEIDFVCGGESDGSVVSCSAVVGAGSLAAGAALGVQGMKTGAKIGAAGGVKGAIAGAIIGAVSGMVVGLAGGAGAHAVACS